MDRNTVTRATAGTMSAIFFCLIAGFASLSLAADADTSKTPLQKADIKTVADHSRTGFVLRDVHATLKCEQCHVEGIFKNTPKNCSGCHAIGTRVASKPQPVNHVPTTAECDTCHTSAANFLVKSYKHVGVTGNCIICHNNQSLGVVSKPMTHFPTLLPCETCHTNTSTFLNWRMDHTGITSGCYMCHGGPEAGANTYPSVVSYPSSHVPVGATSDCNACHTNFVTFVGAQFQHTAGSTCTDCHAGTMPGVVSINRSIHIPVGSATCTSCHADPTTQALPTFLGVVFHTTASGNTSAAAIAFGGSCAACHNGSYVSQNASTKGVTHIPTTADCGNCHTDSSGTPPNTTLSFTTFLNVQFHTSILGNPASSIGTSGPCSTCHNGGYLAAGAQAKNTGHVTTTMECVACHTATNTASFTTFLGATFSHVPGVYGTFPGDGTTASPLCGSCHNGATATGKVSGHVTTTADCNTSGCHTSVSPNTTGCPSCVNFSGVIFSHVGVGKPYTTFPTAAPAAPRCDSCHNGSTLLAQPVNAGHIPTAGADCITCHTPSNTGCGTTGACATFLNATFSHTTTTAPAGSCGTCHQGQYASVVSINPAIHIPQSSGNACDACHTDTLTSIRTSTTPTFLGVVFHQNALGNPPSGLCSTCHSGTYVSTQAISAQSKSSVITNHVATTADCVTCHTTVNTANYTTFLGAGFTHSPGTYASWPPAQPPSPTCASCHNGVTATGTNTGHPAIGQSDCMSCHTAAILQGCPQCSLFGIPAAVVHNIAPYNTPGSCVTCHNGTTAVGLSSDASHINTAGTTGCDQCHSVYDGAGSINFSTSATSTITVNGISKYTMRHTGLVGRCDSCHNGSYTGQGIYGAVAKVSNHIPTAIISTAANTDCTTCHTTLTLATITVVSGTLDWANETMNHNSDVGGAPNYCVTCHLKGVTYLQPKAQLISHNGASTTKDCSSSSCHKPLGTRGTPYSSWD